MVYPLQTKPNQISEGLPLLLVLHKTPFLARDAGKGVFLFRQEVFVPRWRGGRAYALT